MAETIYIFTAGITNQMNVPSPLEHLEDKETIIQYIVQDTHKSPGSPHSELSPCTMHTCHTTAIITILPKTTEITSKVLISVNVSQTEVSVRLSLWAPCNGSV